MKLRKHAEGQTSLAEINIIPLVDVILVLLIVFMVTAPLLQQGVDIDLPEVNAASVSASKEDLVLSVDHDGRIFIGEDRKNQYSLQTLEDKLAAVFENKKKKEIYLHADQGIRYGYIVHVMALCQKVGIERIGMITVPEEKKKERKK